MRLRIAIHLFRLAVLVALLAALHRPTPCVRHLLEVYPQATRQAAELACAGIEQEGRR